ncbi:MAG TPA: helix-turn-helix domain-containing protein [Bradyrhizobium sp.]|uniref:helix-turn-helix transcriptional regulator n=1 Tax=Bradyrhizobium sp. TaxID=376 RepID=UPI002C58370A|nr:helix-turn-helix domain-containing protein [Bradyrhizobium sp.]HXB77514.1 helix-turn-helix domain-containing protein [Bradyrhizobium sp.]
MSAPNKYLTTKEAAHYVRLSESSLEKKRVSGDGPEFLKVGKAVRYEQTALDAWMQTDRRTSTADVAA